MKRALRWFDLVNLNIYWLGLSSISQTMTPLVVPLLIQQFVGDADKGSYYGTLRLWTLMTALLAQSSMGMLSDRSQSKFGRRRPFILMGSIFSLVCIALVGLSSSLQGQNGYWVLFLIILLLAVASNVSQAAQQGLIPDLVPTRKRGLYSGVKALFEIPLPLILISVTVAKLIANSNLWSGIFIVMAVVLGTMILTMFVPEEQIIPSHPQPSPWMSFFRLSIMVISFTSIILGMGTIVGWVEKLIPQNLSSEYLLIWMGLVGIFAMAIAIAFGVWISTRIGLGDSKNRNTSFTWWIVNRLAFLVGVYNLASFTVYFLQGRLGFVREKAAGPASILTLFVGVFILLSALPSGWLADRFGHKRLVMISGLVAAFGTLVAILTTSLPVIYLGGCLIGTATGLFITSNWALGTQLVPNGEAGKYFGIANLAGAGAGAIGAYIGGPVADFITHQIPDFPGAGYLLLFAIYGLLFLGSSVALAGIHPELESLSLDVNQKDSLGSLID